MRLKLYRAPRMADAMAQLRAELGEEAVILETRRVAGGIEITAALDPPEDEPLIIPPSQPASQDVEELGLRAPVLMAPAIAVATPPSRPDPLHFHNLPPALAGLLRDGGLDSCLQRRLRFAAIPEGLEKPLMLLGPPGAGKTLSCAKLAARLVLSGQPPLVISTDRARAGATAQLAAFTSLLGLTLAVAPQPAMLSKALTHRSKGQPVLIDTAGADPFNARDAAGLVALLRTSDADSILVLPGGMDPAEAAEQSRAFAALGTRHMLPTRLDQTRRLGSVLAAAHAADLALTEAGTGPGPADGLTRLTPTWLAARLAVPRSIPQEAA